FRDSLHARPTAAGVAEAECLAHFLGRDADAVLTVQAGVLSLGHQPLELLLDGAAAQAWSQQEIEEAKDADHNQSRDHRHFFVRREEHDGSRGGPENGYQVSDNARLSP